MESIEEVLQETNYLLGSDMRGTVSKKRRLISEIMQPDIVSNLRACINAYKNRVGLSGGQVGFENLANYVNL